MGVPAADVDEAEIELLAHQPADAPSRQLEAARRDGAAIGRDHFLGHRAVDVVAHLEAFGHRAGEGVLRIHALDELRLAVVDAGLADRGDADVRDLVATAEHERQLLGVGDRARLGEHADEPRHEAGIVVAGGVDRLAELDGVLGLEMAAGEIVGAGERHEGDLPLLPQRIERILQRRMQAPVGIERERGVGGAGMRAGDRERRPRLVIEIARDGDDDVRRVIGAAQEHHEEARIGLRRRPHPSGDGHRNGHREGGR